jgi:ComF family protein
MTSNACGGTPRGTKSSRPTSLHRPHPDFTGLRRGCIAALDALIAAVIAPACVVCGEVLDHALGGPCCAECWASIPPLGTLRCHSCGVPAASWRRASGGTPCAACRRRPSAVDRGVVAADYSGALRQLVHAFKYDRRVSLADPLSRLLRTRAAAVIADADAVVPVPLHRWRRLQRGFDQAAALAAGLGLPVCHALRRTRQTPAQVGLSAAARRRNVRGAFAPARQPAWARCRLQGRTVLLVDDVRTTGATLHECAVVLKELGAAEVLSAALAQAPLKD